MINLILKILVRGIKTASLIDDSVCSDLKQLPQNYIVKILVAPNNKNICFCINNGSVKKLKQHNNPNLTIEFKDEKSALNTMLGKMSVATAFAEHRLKVYGNLNHAMVLTRVINIVECYLFPTIITSKLFTPLPDLEKSKMKFYFKMIF